MGKVFLIEKEGPVYTCSTCSIQIAHRNDLMNDGMELYEFSDAYNVTIGEDTVSYGDDVFDGNEVSCVNCCNLLGWRELEEHPDYYGRLVRIFRFKRGRVIPPPENPPLPAPPPPEDPAPQENPPEVQS